MNLEAVLNLKRPSFRFPFSISPSGQWLALTIPAVRPKVSSIGVSSEVAGSSQWIYDLNTNRGFEIITEPGRSSWSGTWSPVEDTLAFYCDLDGEAGLWLWNENSGIIRISKRIVRPFFGFESPIWTPDGRHIIVKSMPSEEVDNSHFSLSLADNSCFKEPISVYNTSNEGDTNAEKTVGTWVNRYRADVVKIDFLTAKSQVIAQGFNPLGFAVSHDGSLLVFAHAVGLEKKTGYQQMRYDLWVVPVHSVPSKKPICIAKNIYLEGPTFSWCDDKTIVYTTGGPLADGALWGINVDGKSEPHRIAFSERIKFFQDTGPLSVLDNGDTLLVSGGKLWMVIRETGEMINVTQDWDRQVIAVLSKEKNQYVIVQTREPKKEMYGFYRIDLSSGLKEHLYEGPRMLNPWYIGGSAFLKTEHKEILVFVAETECDPPAIYRLDIDSKQTHKIGELNPEIASDTLGAVKIIEWSLENQKLKGILMLPSGRNEELIPVIVRVYGGAMQSRGWRYYGCTPISFENNHLFTSCGYAVFLPDLPVSRHEPTDSITKGLDAAIQALVSQPEIDRNKIGIIGHSFGGYTALVGVTRLKWFKTAVVSAGIADLISLATHFDPGALDDFFARVEGGQIALRETIWDNHNRYITNSPMFEFDRIDASILLLQGTNDPICAAQAGPMYSSLRRLGKTAELVLYNGEDHTPSYWKEENKKDYVERIIKWFDQYL